MKQYRLIKRGLRGGTFYAVNCETGKRESLGIKDPAEAQRIINAKNEALRQPFINLQIAKAYLSGSDEKLIRRTWEEVFDARIETAKGVSKTRWLTAKKDKAFAPLLHKPLIETTADDFLAVLKANKVSTIIHLRKIQNFALDMDWLPKAVIPKRRWPAVVYKQKRAITFEEHQRIIENEKNPEWRALYNLLWHIGDRRVISHA